VLLAVQTLAGVVCFVSVLDLADTMLYGQLVFQAAFLTGVASALRAELPEPRTRPHIPPRVRVRHR